MAAQAREAPVQQQMQVAENFQLKWHSFGSHLHASVATLLHSETFADVILCTADGRSVSAHRFVLAACSSYLQGLLGHGSLSANGHLPVVVIMPTEISHATLCTLIRYMYSGEATVSHAQLDAVLRAGDILRIRGLYRPPRGREKDQHQAGAHSGVHSGASAAQPAGGGQPHHLLKTLEGYVRKPEYASASGLGVHRHFMDPTRASTAAQGQGADLEQGQGVAENQLGQLLGHSRSRVGRTPAGLGPRVVGVSPRMISRVGTRVGRRGGREYHAQGLKDRRKTREARDERWPRGVVADRAAERVNVRMPRREVIAEPRKCEPEPELQRELEAAEKTTEQEGDKDKDKDKTMDADEDKGTDCSDNLQIDTEKESGNEDAGAGEPDPDQDVLTSICKEEVPDEHLRPEEEMHSPRPEDNHPKENQSQTRVRKAGAPEARANGEGTESNAIPSEQQQGEQDVFGNLVEMRIKEEPIEWDMESEVRQALLDDMPAGVRVKPEQGEVVRGPELMYSPLTCEYCQQTFYCPGDWVRHAETQHAELRRRPRRRGTRGRQSSHDSDRSGQSASTSNDTVAGLGAGAGGSSSTSTTAGGGSGSGRPSAYPALVCDVCSEAFDSPGAWARHLQTSHTDEELAMHNKKDALQSPGTHITRQFPLKSRRCGLCNKTFLSKASLQIHRRTHTGERPYVCTDCNKGFNVKSNFLRHMRTLHNRVISPSSARATSHPLPLPPHLPLPPPSPSTARTPSPVPEEAGECA